jgi:hypothetical protein
MASDEFAWEDTRVGTTAPLVSLLRHNSTGYSFLFDFYPNGNQKNVYSPAEHELTFEQNHSSWDTTFRNVEDWARFLAREIHAKSFLDLLQDVPALEHSAKLDIEDTPFNAEELQHIAAKLALIEARVLASTGKLESHTEYVEAQFERIKQLSKSMGRISWLQLFIGALVSNMSAFVEPNAVKTIWQFANEQISSIFSKLRMKG